ncbi:MAG: polyphosphate polymerase domain-containing protein [Eggerthellaceae bacterium]|nr:polyphosphate polymerase domain-containing protein [Eggerthellaceae bacterium]
MAKFCEVFERIEKKYRLSGEQYQLMKAALQGHMAPDRYGRTRITSLYFDTPDRSLIARSLEKPRYKEKLRLRMYGSEGKVLLRPDGWCELERALWNQPAYLEIKKKFEGVVYKRRVGLTLAAARAYWCGMPYEKACERFPLEDEGMAKESLAPRSRQIAREIDRFRERYESLEPSMAITCERSAWEPAKDADGKVLDESCSNLRITFDERLQYVDWLGQEGFGKLGRSIGIATEESIAIARRSIENAVTADDAGHERSVIAPDEVIMEIKCAGSYPLWMTHALADTSAYPASFSKYGTAYMKGGRCA